MRIQMKAGVVVAALLVAACSTSRLLDVTAPNSVPVTIFDSPTSASLMVNSAIGDLECAYGAAVLIDGVTPACCP